MVAGDDPAVGEEAGQRQGDEAEQPQELELRTLLGQEGQGVDKEVHGDDAENDRVDEVQRQPRDQDPAGAS